MTLVQGGEQLGGHARAPREMGGSGQKKGCSERGHHAC